MNTTAPAVRVSPAKLKAARLSAKMTGVHVAKSVGIHQNTLAGYETGYRPVPGDILVMLCSMYRVSVESLTTTVGREAD